MTTRPKQIKRTHLKHPGHKGRGASNDQVWSRRLWVSLIVFVLLSIAVTAFYARDQWFEGEEDVFVDVAVRTVAGDEQAIICKLSILIDPEQEQGIKSRQKQLESIVSAALAEIYQGAQPPEMSAVRQRLHFAINQKMPRKLQVRDVLIQELLVGSG